MPARSRASISTACWKPPHVPRSGMRRSRARRTAATAPSGLRYGLPGTTQMPSNPSSAAPSSTSSEGIQYGSSTIPSRRRKDATRSGIRAWARTLWERSPTRAMEAVVMDRDPGHRGRSCPTIVPRPLITDTDGLVDPRFLRTFAAVVRLASFSAAARELGYTQSAVSQHIAVLEADLGAALVHRRPVTPTEAGTRLREHAGAILLRLDAARADVARAVAEAPGRLVVGATPLSAPIAARAVAPAGGAPPPVAVAVRVADRDAIAVAVATGELDAGIVDGAAAPGDALALPETGVPVAAFAEEPLALAVAPGHALARRAAVRLEDLVDARWIDAPAVATPLPALAMLASAEGFRPAVRYDGLDVAGLLALVEHGEGIALLPAAAAPHGVAVSAPPLVHRTELLAVDVAAHPDP